MTPDQAATGCVLEDLGFKLEPAALGSEPTYEITAEIVKKLATNQGKKIVVPDDGILRIE